MPEARLQRTRDLEPSRSKTRPQVVSTFLGDDLSLHEALQKIPDAARDLLASVPPRCVVHTQWLTPAPAGALTVDLANGCRVLLQYSLEYDTYQARLQVLVDVD